MKKYTMSFLIQSKGVVAIIRRTTNENKALFYSIHNQLKVVAVERYAIRSEFQFNFCQRISNVWIPRLPKNSISKVLLIGIIRRRGITASRVIETIGRSSSTCTKPPTTKNSSTNMQRGMQWVRHSPLTASSVRASTIRKAKLTSQVGQPLR